MSQKLSTPVSVNLVYNHKTQDLFPRHVLWNNRMYKVRTIGLHHTYRQGKTLYHVFSVATKNLFLRLILDTETLHWKLEEISDKT